MSDAQSNANASETKSDSSVTPGGGGVALKHRNEENGYAPKIGSCDIPPWAVAQDLHLDLG